MDTTSYEAMQSVDLSGISVDRQLGQGLSARAAASTASDVFESFMRRTFAGYAPQRMFADIILGNNRKVFKILPQAGIAMPLDHHRRLKSMPAR